MMTCCYELLSQKRVRRSWCRSNNRECQSRLLLEENICSRDSQGFTVDAVVKRRLETDPQQKSIHACLQMKDTRLLRRDSSTETPIEWRENSSFHSLTTSSSSSDCVYGYAFCIIFIIIITLCEWESNNLFFLGNKIFLIVIVNLPYLPSGSCRFLFPFWRVLSLLRSWMQMKS
jgi:hypothetical protein